MSILQARLFYPDEFRQREDRSKNEVAAKSHIGCLSSASTDEMLEKETVSVMLVHF